MFNYSQKDINENFQGENLYEQNKKEDIILNYKPISQILKYIDKANNDKQKYLLFLWKIKKKKKKKKKKKSG
ncbi:U6 snRNA-associated Sm-like protein LSm1 [Plasmodium yoelii yoelii]|uniref:U6 snRNA-associated Sm-like protein LSm1 n=1 Tax=Plasmodium yoelii yoelii TaxID=73239 RepID=A0AAF0B5K0_PLAYO|nr:U6 snRNA-associated Sm-like protein LSm1 [Plasmodium yoelii yoelii]